MTRGWRMPAKCDNCPFRDDDAAIELRPGRLEGIKDAVVLGKAFPCHKTTRASGKRRRDHLECAGALEYRERVYREQGTAGVQAAFDRIMA